MDRFVDVLFRRGRLIMTTWLLLTAVGAAFAVGLEGRAVPGGEAASDSQAEIVAQELGRNGVPLLYVVVTGDAAAPGAAGAGGLEDLRDVLAGTPGVSAVAPLPLPPAAPSVEPVVVLGVSTDGGVDGSIDVARRILDTEHLAPAGSEAFLGGYGAHREELVELSRSDLLRAERVGLPIVLVVLLLMFGTLAASAVPLTIGLAAMAGGLGAAGALAFVVPFSEYVTNAATMVGLALAIDYAMFLVQRVREGLLRGAEVDDAVRDAMRTTGVAIAWSGFTVLFAVATMFLVDARSIRTAALGMVLVTAATVVAALVAGPLVLRRLGHRILRRPERELLRRARGERPPGPRHRANRSRGLPVSMPVSVPHTVPSAATSRGRRRDGSGFWRRWGRRTTGRPGLWLSGGVLVLAALCVPAFGITERVALPSASAMPADSHVRQATEIGTAAFGPGVLSPVEVVVHSTAETVEGHAHRVAAALRADARVLDAQPLPLEGQETYRVTVATAQGPADEDTAALVESLREGQLHQSLGGIRYDVGGEAAMRLDANHALFESLPLMLGVLLMTILVLFTVAMRSVVLPVKAVLMVVLSLGASAGALLLLSTTTVGAQLLGWSQPEDLHPIVPVTIVAIVVALSTDYEIILISRIAELFRETGDNTSSIIDGVAHTGRVISSAAAIMIAVFLGFALSDVTALRQLGAGLAIAVLIDATVVRGVLVPASMQLMGRWNWWLPSLPRPRLSSAAPSRRPAAPAPAEAFDVGRGVSE